MGSAVDIGVGVCFWITFLRSFFKFGISTLEYFTEKLRFIREDIVASGFVDEDITGEIFSIGHICVA